MNKSSKIKTVFLISISASAIILLYFVNLKTAETIQTQYANFFVLTNEKSVNLTRNYQDQIALWQSGIYSNDTMADITENFLKNFTNQMVLFNNTEAPDEFANIKTSLAQSLLYEIRSYELFKDYLITGNSTKNDLSTDYLSESLKNEAIAFQQFKRLTETT